MNSGVKCNEIRERMPEVAAGFSEPTVEEGKHLESCAACADQLKSMRATMTLLDEWQAPEPSLYFDVRLQARLREEMAKPQAGWLYWLRRPVLAAALTVLMGVGVGLFFTQGSGIYKSVEGGPVAEAAEPGTAVSDLESLEKNHDLYSDFEVLDDLSLQQDVVANP
jgi:predicted anti-sigma-YlaC factor YlaD